MRILDIFKEDIKIINLGSPSFLKDYERQQVKHINIEWKPPAGGNIELIEALNKLSLREKEIDEANEKAVNILKTSEANLIDIDKAVNVIPNMTEKMILHSGPPVKWENMAGPMKGAIIGAILYEGLAKNVKEAEELAQKGNIKFSPCHEHNTVGPMAGIVSPSMPVHVVENKKYGNRAYCTVNEGLGKVLRYGANSEEVINRLKWIETTYRPVLKEALKINGPIDIKSIVTQALQMGDECHNRNKAATSLFYREVAVAVLKTNCSMEDKISSLEFIKNNEHYFLNLSMPLCKAALDAARGIENSTVVTAMARNGYEFGIQVSGLGNRWFVAPANYVKGLMFPGFTEEDAAPDIGDSAITETMGIGGFAMGSSPAIVQFVGGSVEDAFNYSLQMHEVTAGENKNFTIPSLDFKGTAIGIDIRKVIETGTLPIINTGMAHKEAGVGQVGAGLVSPPRQCFVDALLAFKEKM